MDDLAGLARFNHDWAGTARAVTDAQRHPRSRRLRAHGFVGSRSTEWHGCRAHDLAFMFVLPGGFVVSAQAWTRRWGVTAPPEVRSACRGTLHRFYRASFMAGNGRCCLDPDGRSCGPVWFRPGGPAAAGVWLERVTLAVNAPFWWARPKFQGAVEPAAFEGCAVWTPPGWRPGPGRADGPLTATRCPGPSPHQRLSRRVPSSRRRS